MAAHIFPRGSHVAIFGAGNTNTLPHGGGIRQRAITKSFADASLKIWTDHGHGSPNSNLGDEGINAIAFGGNVGAQRRKRLYAIPGDIRIFRRGARPSGWAASVSTGIFHSQQRMTRAIATKNGQRRSLKLQPGRGFLAGSES